MRHVLHALAGAAERTLVTADLQIDCKPTVHCLVTPASTTHSMRLRFYEFDYELQVTS